MNWVHPRKRTLKRWLESTDAGPVDEHISTCRRCANRLEDLAAPTPALGDAISQTIRPPDDLAERLRRPDDRFDAQPRGSTDLPPICSAFRGVRCRR